MTASAYLRLAPAFAFGPLVRPIPARGIGVWLVSTANACAFIAGAGILAAPATAEACTQRRRWLGWLSNACAFIAGAGILAAPATAEACTQRRRWLGWLSNACAFIAGAGIPAAPVDVQACTQRRRWLVCRSNACAFIAGAGILAAPVDAQACTQRRRWLVCLSNACVFIAGAGIPAAPVDAQTSAPAPPFRAPYLPVREDEVLQEVPSTADPAVARMVALRARVAAAPHSLPLALDLAGAYVDYGRQVGDAHYAGYAEAVIAPWFSAPPPPPNVLLTQATILQYRHQFPEARELLQQTLSQDPGNAQAWLTLATLDMVQGDYESAGKDCVRVSTRAGFQVGLACSANLRSYTGHARQSLAVLAQVQAAGGGPTATRAWIAGLMAEAAERLGDWPLAETHYREALTLLPRDNFLLVAYADFLLDRSRPQEVLTLLAEHAQSDTAFLRIALAESALHGADAERDIWIMAARFEALMLRGSDFFGREQARFALALEHDPTAALDLATRNWHVQREPWDTRLLLEAAIAAQQPHAAAEALEFIRKSNLEDPLIAPLAQKLRAQLKTGYEATPHGRAPTAALLAGCLPTAGAGAVK